MPRRIETRMPPADMENRILHTLDLDEIDKEGRKKSIQAAAEDQ